jgi:N-acetyl-gamma-glutamylphosphate reductase
MIDLARTRNPILLDHLRKHPRVGRVDDSGDDSLEFEMGSWRRRIEVGRSDLEVYGLTEFIDNNPMVCADQISLPSAAVALALLALAPVIDAGLLAESPVGIFSCPVDETELEVALQRVGWVGGMTTQSEPMEIGSALALTVMVAIRTPEDPAEIGDVYEERYGRSLYVRRGTASDWDASGVIGSASGLYRFTVSPDSPTSLLTVRALGDRHGKLGELAMIHAMNVMAGFEESLGIAE